MATTKTNKQKLQDRAKAAVVAKAAAKAEAQPGDRIDLLLKTFQKQLGSSGTIYRGKDVVHQNGKRAPTGVPSLDYVLCGGPTEGSLIEICAPYSTGKTTLAIRTLIEAQTREWAKPAHERRGQLWVALEPFSKRWARQLGFWIPFNEDETVDPDTGELVKLDSFDDASPVELHRMAQLGIEDPYAEITPFLLVSTSLGDEALDMVVEAVRSNAFTHIVVDSLAVAKSTKWVEEKDVRAHEDFPREARMINDYTTRCMLMLNKRYDAVGNESPTGTFPNRTVVLNLNQVSVNIGTQARAAHNKYTSKGGEGKKHNLHAMVFMDRKEVLSYEGKGGTTIRYGQRINLICTKSKVGVPWRSADLNMYFDDFEDIMKGDVDVMGSAFNIGLVLGVIASSGSFYSYGDRKVQGREAFIAAMKADEPFGSSIVREVQLASRAK